MAEKRDIFPRLYFLSDDDLLELLGQARAGAGAAGRELVVQTHLRKLFPGVTRVSLGAGALAVTALESAHGERLVLDTPVDIDRPVEVWLKSLEDEMRRTLRNAVLRTVTDETFWSGDPLSSPTQILCLAQNIRFTELAERAILAKELHGLKDRIQKECDYYIGYESEEPAERVKRQALVLQCSHYLEVLAALAAAGVAAPAHPLWQNQLRFYVVERREVVARMGLAQLACSYEYLGLATHQFVRTRLTDRCFLVLTQAYYLGQMGNPFGPAGTGKTESVKALGALLGRLVLVFNCDEAMDTVCLSRLLSGLALCGAWGCFDEFNRLAADTLAAASAPFGSLLAALKQSASEPAQPGHATLNGKQVVVSRLCGAWCTLNEAGRGYGGRRALGGAWAALLRPLAMGRVPRARLAHRLLALHAPRPRPLAAALVLLYDMARELLSAQHHYDWGLRALKAAVGSCADALHAHRAGRAHATDAQLDAQQSALVRRVLALNNISKLTHDDAIRFRSILSLVFPDVVEEEDPRTELDDALEAAVKALGYVYKKEQIQKCKEFYEQLQQRMGVVTVGPPCSGKTTIRLLLKNALSRMGRTVVEYTICPKAVPRAVLLGQIDHDTRKWTDGIISSVSLDVSNQPPEVWSWVVCDGDVDPEWVEALNSVLDDTRALTLPGGWRVQFRAPPSVNFVFETHSLRHASPATVSRLAVILMSEEDSCGSEVVERWAGGAELDGELAQLAVPLLRAAVGRCLDWARGHGADFVLRPSAVAMVKQVLVQFEYLAQGQAAFSVMSGAEELVGTALGRAVCPLLKDKARDAFCQQVCEVPASALSLEGGGAGRAGLGAAWAEGGVHVSARLAAAARSITAALHARAHVLVLGPPACAKSAVLEQAAREAAGAHVVSVTCTPLLQPADLVDELRRSGAIGGGGVGGGGGCVLVVRALHRARADVWGSTLLHAFLLQLIQHGGFWERGSEGVTFCPARSVRVLMSCSLRAALCPRLLNAASLTLIREPEDDELLELGHTSLQRCAGQFMPDERLLALNTAMLHLYKQVSSGLASQTQYRWSARDYRRWCDGIKWYAPHDANSFVKAIVAESYVIFRNRLVSADDVAVFDDAVSRTLGTATDHLYVPRARGAGVYFDPVDRRDWPQIINKFINQCANEHEYNAFGDVGAEATDELATLCTAIAAACNGGLCVCVSASGAGRRAAARLVAAMLPAKLYPLQHARDLYTVFKNAVNTAGCEATKALVLIEESVAAPALGVVEAVLEAGSAHRLPAAVAPSLPPHADQHAFLANLKQNLGIVVLLDKNQDGLQDLLERCPFLYEKSFMVWLDSWSEDTLREMPSLVIQRLVRENASSGQGEDTESVPAEGFAAVYATLDSDVMRAPARYVNFIKSFYHISRAKKASLSQRMDTLRAGVAALTSAREQVAALKASASEQEAALSEKQAGAHEALMAMSATVQSATARQEQMALLKRDIEQEEGNLQARKKEIEEELASVEPVIEAARAAVGDIKPEALSEVRSLRAPPDVVRDVLEGVLRLMGIADTSWHSMKSFLARRGVSDDIRKFDASQISSESLEAVSALVARRGASFEERAARRASAVCAPLAAWVRANLAYALVLRRVRPLLDHQALLHKRLAEAESRAVAVGGGLASVEARVGELRGQLAQHTRDAAQLELRLADAQRTIAGAERLVQRLRTEYAAWEAQLKELEVEMSEVRVRSLLAAAYVVYLPDATADQTKSFMSRWSEALELASDFSPVNFLSSVEEQLGWDAQGLPVDGAAVKNALVIHQTLQPVRCGFTPLIIDPDGEARDWLANTLADLSCDFIQQHSDKISTAIQHATRFGKILVVSEVDSIEESWAPLLRGCPATEQGALHAGFRLVLYSRDATLPARLPPYCLAHLTVVDFAPKLHGLTDQLVQSALRYERPEMNEKLKELKIQKASMQKQQYQLQEHLLKELSSATDILHNEAIISSLASTRETSETITKSLADAKVLEDRIRQMYVAYEPAARRAAMLLLAVRDLTTVRYPLVSLPVDTLLTVFIEALDKGKNPKSDGIDLEETVKYLTCRVVERALLSVRKRDKYIVALHILRAAYPDLVTDQLWNLVVGTASSVDEYTLREVKSACSWADEPAALSLARIKVSQPELYAKLRVADTTFWAAFAKSRDTNVLRKLQLSAFEEVAVVHALHPPALYAALAAFVDRHLGAGLMSRCGGSVGGGARWAGRAAAHAAPAAVLLVGAHAAQHLAAHAHANKIALSQMWLSGEEHELEELSARAEECARGGAWLAVHVGGAPLSHALLHALPRHEHAQQERADCEFVVWLVTEEREIPAAVASACVVVLLEAPEGIRNNVLSTLSVWGAGGGGDVRAAGGGDVRVTRMLACLAMLHAVIQERRAYIPQGWSRWYSWEWGDAESARCVALGAGAGGGVWAALVGVLYAGRVGGGGGGGSGDADVLRALLRDHTAEHVFAHAYAPPGHRHPLPHSAHLQEYASAVASFPLVDSPAALGLAENVRAAWEVNAARAILAGLRELNAVARSEGASDDVSAKPVLALWKKLMAHNPLLRGDAAADEKVSSEEAAAGAADEWWGEVVRGEVAAARHACAGLHAELARLRRSAGPLHKTPEEWQAIWSGPEYPLQYVAEVAHRANTAHAALLRYRDRARTSPPAPAHHVVECGGVWSVGRAVWAARAAAARALRVSPAALHLRATWLPARPPPSAPARPHHGTSPADGVPSVTLCGLTLEGATWEGEGAGGLRPAAADAPPAAPAPPIRLHYALADVGEGMDGEDVEEGEEEGAGRFLVPVYSDARRHELVLRVPLPPAPAPSASPALSPHLAALHAVALYVTPLGTSAPCPARAAI